MKSISDFTTKDVAKKFKQFLIDSGFSPNIKVRKIGEDCYRVFYDQTAQQLINGTAINWLTENKVL